MNKKMKAGLIGVAAFGLLVAMTPVASGSNITANGTEWSDDRVTQVRELDEFTKIHIKGAIKLVVTGGKDQNVSIEMNEDFVKYLITEVVDGTLVIDMDGKGKKSHWKSPKVEVTISMQTLNAIELDGAMDASFSNLSGSDLDVNINGAGNLEIEGSCGTLTVRLKGAGNIEAEDFKCKNADIKLSGAGNIEAYATEKANILLAGIGNIDISGSPKEVSKKKGGLGSIDIR